MNCFAYIRVSTTKQRDQGASLEAQRDAIKRYARKHGLTITKWYQETKTAAKGGRAEFTKLIKALKAGKAQGTIVHKIDRSARNLRDWSDFIGLMEHGIQIHVASENLDLSSRGGRLSADIQAVVAADYIRNLRLEALKGIRARYQQGLLPAKAPLGYRDHGSGKVKTIDPTTGPLVRELFERYATGSYSLRSIQVAMDRRGLKNSHRNPLSINSISKILNNPFYYGLLVMRGSGETFQGKHEPLITKRLFEACEGIREGRTKHRALRHRYPYSRLLKCSECGYSLVAERQKGHVYYRCHSKGCPVRSKRQDEVESVLSGVLERLALDEDQRTEVEGEIERVLGLRSDRTEEVKSALALEIRKHEERLDRLTDLLIDGVLDEVAFRVQKRRLLERLVELRDQYKRDPLSTPEIQERVRDYLEQAQTAWLSYEKGSDDRKRQIVQQTTSNLTVTPESVVVELQFPFQSLLGRDTVLDGGGLRDEPRTPRPDHHPTRVLPSGQPKPDAKTIAERLLQCAEAELETEEGGD